MCSQKKSQLDSNRYGKLSITLISFLEFLYPIDQVTGAIPKRLNKYRALNNITIKYRHPIPKLDDHLDKLHGACVLCNIDLKSGPIKLG